MSQYGCHSTRMIHCVLTLIILVVCWSTSAAAIVVGRESTPSNESNVLLTLNNSFIGVSWLVDSHALVQLYAIDSLGVVTEFLSSSSILACDRGWWEMFLVTPDTPPDQPMRIDAFTQMTQKSVELVSGDGYVNASFSYIVPLTSTSSVVVTIDAQLCDDAKSIEFFMRLEQNPMQPYFPIGLENATITLQGIAPTAVDGGSNPHTAVDDGDGVDLLVLPSGFGMLIADPTHTYTDPYPAHYPNSDATYQTIMYYFNRTDTVTRRANGPGLFIEAHDELGSEKVITYQLSSTTMKSNASSTGANAAPDGGSIKSPASAAAALPVTFELSMTVFPTNAGQDLSLSGTADGIVPYPLVWGVFQGDWSDGIANYATWARRSAAWMSAGSMENRTRTDTPEWLLDINFWMNTGWQQLDIFNATEGDPTVVIDRVTRMMDLLQLPSPVGLHWYEWDQIKFDTGYPEYFPVKTGFGEAVQKLHDAFGAQLKIAPYMSALRIDTRAHTETLRLHVSSVDMDCVPDRMSPRTHMSIDSSVCVSAAGFVCHVVMVVSLISAHRRGLRMALNRTHANRLLRRIIRVIIRSISNPTAVDRPSLSCVQRRNIGNRS
jgi:hypothetical protein